MTPTFPFSVIDAHGQVKFSGHTQHTDDLAPPGCSVVLESPVDDAWYDGSGWVPIGASPSSDHTFDWPTHRWVDPRTLEDLKTSLVAQAASTRWALVDASDAAGLRTAVQDLEASGGTHAMFKSRSGWTIKPAAELRAQLKRVAEYVQLCFAAEHAHVLRIAALTSIPDALTYSLADQPTGPT